MNDRIDIGAVGLGAFMARQHLPNLRKHPAVRIHTLCDVNEELLRKRVAEYQPLKWTTRAEDVFADPEIDAIVVGVRHSQHAKFIAMAAAHGKSVFVEKPMTMTYEETRVVLDVVRGSGIRVGVGFNRRFAPSMVEAKRLFSAYRRGPANLFYRIVDDHRIRPAYVFDMNDGGGHLLAEGCHIFDLLTWFLDEEPVEVYAAGPLETDNAVVLKYSGGSLAALLCGGKGGLLYPKELMEVFCNATTLAVDNFYEIRMDGPGGNCLRRFPLAPRSAVKLGHETMTAFYESDFAARPAYDVVGAHAGNDLPTPSVDKGHRQLLDAFIGAVRTSAPFAPGVVDGARATVCALKCYEAIRLNRPVSIQSEAYGLVAGSLPSRA